MSDLRDFNKRFFSGSDTRSIWTRARTSYLTPFLIAGSITLGYAACVSTKERIRTSQELAAGKIAYPLDNTVPTVPYDWQKKARGDPPKCGKREVNIFGACYLRAHPGDFQPPCEPPTAEYEGACYSPLGEPPPKKPVSGE